MFIKYNCKKDIKMYNIINQFRVLIGYRDYLRNATY